MNDCDQGIVTRRMAALDSIQGPRVGDFVDFADGTRRISHLWEADWYEDGIARIQTSQDGSYYLGEGYVSFSGSLYPAIPAATLTPDGTREGSAWIFHSDHWCAQNGIDFKVPFRVFTSADNAPH